MQPDVGHYGVFNGSRFRSEIAPRIADFVLSHATAPAADGREAAGRRGATGPQRARRRRRPPTAGSGPRATPASLAPHRRQNRQSFPPYKLWSDSPPAGNAVWCDSELYSPTCRAALPRWQPSARRDFLSDWPCRCARCSIAGRASRRRSRSSSTSRSIPCASAATGRRAATRCASMRPRARSCSPFRRAAASREAKEFAQKHGAWIAARLQRLPKAAPFADGIEVPLRGVPHRIEHRPGARHGLDRKRRRRRAAAVRRRRGARTSTGASPISSSARRGASSKRRAAAMRKRSASTIKRVSRARPVEPLGLVLEQRRAVVLLAAHSRAAVRARLSRGARGRASGRDQPFAAVLAAVEATQSGMRARQGLARRHGTELHRYGGAPREQSSGLTSAPAEQPVDQPAVEAAARLLRLLLLLLPRRRQPAASARCWPPAAGSRRAMASRPTGRAAPRPARLDARARMKRRPDVDRQAAAGRAACRRGIVVAEPDAGDEVRRCSRRTRRRGNPGWCRSCRPPASPAVAPCCAVPTRSVSRIIAFIIDDVARLDDRGRNRAARARRAPCRLWCARARPHSGAIADAAIGERRIGRDQLDASRLPRCRARATDWARASRRCRAGSAVLATAVGAELQRQPHRDRVERMRERLRERDRPVIFAAVVLRLPALDRDRLVLAHAVGRQSAFERGEIDERLERRARLALGGDGAVELAFGVVPAADQRAHRARAASSRRARLGRH